MKQTNNAIKFLMAQYRAIFKNAYFKGLVSAAVLTAALSAGQAQATDYTFEHISAKSGAATITIDGSKDKLAVVGFVAGDGSPNEGSTKENPATITKNIVLNSGTHTFTTSGSNPFYAKGNTTVKLQNKATLSFGESGATTNNGLLYVNFDGMTVDSGSTLNVYAGARDNSLKSTTITATNLTINGIANIYNGTSNAFLRGDTINIGANAQVQIGATAPLDYAVTDRTRAGLGWRAEQDANGKVFNEKLGSTINVKGGDVTLQSVKYFDKFAHGEGALIWGKELNFTNKASLNVKDDGGYIEVHDVKFDNAQINLSGINTELTKEKGKVPVTENRVNTLNFKLAGPTIMQAKDAYPYYQKAPGANYLNNNGTLTLTDTVVQMSAGSVFQVTRGGDIYVDDKTHFTGGALYIGNDIPSNNNTIWNGSLFNTTNTTLHISSTKLNEYLNSTNEKITNKKDTTKTITDVKGALILQHGARVHFTDDVEMSDFSFAKTTDFATPTNAEGISYEHQEQVPKQISGGLIYIANDDRNGKNIGKADENPNTKDAIRGDIRFVAENMSVAKDLSADEADSSAKQATLEATKLTLGSADFVSGKTLGFKEAYTRDLHVIHSGTDLFKLADIINLSTTRKVDRVDDNGNIKTIYEAETGYLDSLSLVSGGKIIVNGGIYDVGELELASGSLAVTNSIADEFDPLADPKKATESSLTVGNLIVKSTTTTENTVSGEDASLKIKDITASADAKAKFTATSGGVIEVDADDIQNILNSAADKETNNDKHIHFLAHDKGVLKVNGGLEFVYTKDNESSHSVLDETVKLGAGGTLQADYLSYAAKDGVSDTLKGTGTFELNRFEGTAYGETIDNNQPLLDRVKLAATEDRLTYKLKDTFFSPNKEFELQKGVILELGVITDILDEDDEVIYSQAETTDGSLDVAKLIISGENPSFSTTSTGSASVNVEAGNWSGRDIEIGTNGSMSVGGLRDNGKKYYDINDEAITASFTGNRLVMTGGEFRVNGTGIAQFTEVDTSASAANGITVLGEMTVVGNDVTEDKVLEDGTEQNIAVKTSAGSITVGVNDRNSPVRGSLTFNNKAVMNSIFAGLNADGKSIDLKADFAEGTFNVYNNSVVKLEFGDISFNGEQLSDLHSKLFSAGSNGLLNIGDAKFTGLDEAFSGTEAENNITIKWEDLSKYTYVENLENITSNKLALAKVTGVNSDFRAHVGSIELAAASSANITGNSSLSNASGNGGKYVTDAKGNVAGVSVKNGSILDLNNGGEISRVDLGANSVLRTGQNRVTTSETTIAEITGNGEFYAGATKTFVTGNVNVDEIGNIADSYLEIGGNLTVGNTNDNNRDWETAVFDGNLLVKGDAKISGELEVKGTAKFEKDLTATNGANILGNTEVTETAILGGDTDIGNNALFKAKTIALGSDGTTSYSRDRLLVVGIEAGEEPNGDKWDSSAGYVQAERLNLNGGTLIADPDYGRKASIAVFDTVGARNIVDTKLGNVAGTLNGDIVVARNSVVAVGLSDNKTDGTAFEQLNKYLLPSFVDANGSLKRDEVGSIFFVGKALDLQASDKVLDNTINHKSARLVLDSTKAGSDYLAATDNQNKLGKYDKDYTTKIATNNIYLGDKTVLAIDEAAINGQRNGAARGAIHIDQAGASIYGDGGKIVLTGNSFNRRNTITLFTDADNDGIMVDAKGQDIRIETLSGLFYHDFVKGEVTNSFNLKFDRKAADLKFNDASTPVKHDLIAYAIGELNWELDDNTANYVPTMLHGDVAADVKVEADGSLTIAGKPVTDTSKYVVLNGVAYYAAYNEFLEQVVSAQGKGSDAESAARFGIYGGSAQVALAAANTTSDAIAARSGMGGKSAQLSVADNGQGASLWVAPVYKASNSDGFGAQNMNYGVDIDMYGLALGGDYSLGNGMKFGAMFNLGSGDADGNGAATNITNDFDYYGFGAYFGYSVDQFSVLADVSYTIVDNDVSGTTSIDKLTASLDSKALSVGVSAQYEFDLGGVSFVPHAGARYTRLDLDSYDLKGNQIGGFAHNDSSDASIFSIPVGVTISKEFLSETWAVKPFVDLTLTANTGDDEIDSSMSWNGTNMVTGMKSEIFDSFTYGASAGVSAQSGNFSFGVSANYTGSSNMDEYGVSANARFVF